MKYTLTLLKCMVLTINCARRGSSRTVAYSKPTEISHYDDMTTRKRRMDWQHVYTLVGPSYVNSVCYRGDGKMLASGYGNSNDIKIWDLENGGSLAGTLVGHTGNVTSVDYNWNGTKLVSGSTDGTIIVWDMEKDGSIMYTLNQAYPVFSVKFNTDGSTIVSGGDALHSNHGTVNVWNLENDGAIIHSLDAHGGRVTSVDFSPDGTDLASASMDGTVIIWDWRTGVPAGNPLRGNAAINTVDYSHDGTKIAAGSQDGTICIWDLTQNGGSLIQKMEDGGGYSINSVDFRDDGVEIVSRSDDGTVKIWNVEHGSLIETLGNYHVGPSVQFSPGGRQTPSGAADKTVRVWERQLNSSSTIDIPSMAPSISAFPSLSSYVNESSSPSQSNTTKSSVSLSNLTSSFTPTIIVGIILFWIVAFCGMFCCYKQQNNEYSPTGIDIELSNVDQEVITTKKGNKVRVPEELLSYNNAIAKIDNWRDREGIV